MLALTTGLQQCVRALNAASRERPTNSQGPRRSLPAAGSLSLQVRAAIGSHTGCKLLIVESCLSSSHMSSTHTPRMCGDIHMLVQYGEAKERTEQQFGELLQATGFKLNRVIPTKSLFFVMEAVPV